MNEQMSRRAFIGASTAVGASLYLPPRAWAVTNQSKDRDAIQVALIGVGNQGQRLMESVIRLSKHNPVHMRAVCDIWDKNRKRSSKILHAYRAYGHRGTAYIDYQELLEREADLDAVLWPHLISAMQRRPLLPWRKTCTSTVNSPCRIRLSRPGV